MLTNVSSLQPNLPDWFSRDLIEALPMAVYICDVNSVVIGYNARASELWGRKPVRGDTQERFCGAYRMHTADNVYLPHNQSPMATVMVDQKPSGQFEAIIEREDGTRRNVIASVAPLFDDIGNYMGFVNCVQDITDRKRAEQRETEVRDALRAARHALRDNDRTLSTLNSINADLIESGGFLKGILTSVSDCIEVLDCDGRIQFMNDHGQSAQEIDDFETIRGGNWADDYCGEQREAAHAAIAMAKAGGVGRFETLASTLKGKMVWWDVAVTQISDETGNSGNLLAISRDISERKANEEARKLLGQELQHRLKNTLAMVQAIANQTLKSATSIEEAKSVLAKRIAILGRAHDILLQENGSSADLVSIVGAMVDLHADRRERFVVDGPNVHLGPKAAMAIALALHELATNAQKYGALSNDYGKVVLHWAVSDDMKLRLEWTEQDGPEVRAPTTSGFGSRLTQSMLSGSIGGTPKVSYDASGFRFAVETELRAVQV